MSGKVVRLRYGVEIHQPNGVSDVVEVSWGEWAKMSQEEREAYGDELVSASIQNMVSGYCEVDGEEPPPAPTRPGK